MSNIDPSHAIPLLAAGALRSGLAFMLMPRASGFAVLLVKPDSELSDTEIEEHSALSAIADVPGGLEAADTMTLSYLLGRAVLELAEHISVDAAQENVTGQTTLQSSVSGERAYQREAARAVADWYLGITGPESSSVEPPHVHIYARKTGAND